MYFINSYVQRQQEKLNQEKDNMQDLQGSVRSLRNGLKQKLAFIMNIQTLEKLLRKSIFLNKISICLKPFW